MSLLASVTALIFSIMMGPSHKKPLPARFQAH
jgi:hypothetical protein